jgi:hypothetical protein
MNECTVYKNVLNESEPNTEPQMLSDISWKTKIEQVTQESRFLLRFPLSSLQPSLTVFIWKHVRHCTYKEQNETKNIQFRESHKFISNLSYFEKKKDQT